MTDSPLLEYLSERQHGTWSQFRDAVAEVGLRQPPVWIADDLSSLAHLEFQPETLDWGVCPPLFAELPDGGTPRAVLCGWRTAAFLDKLVSSASRARLSIRFDALDPGVPPRLLVGAREWQQIRAYAEGVGLRCARDAARRLSACLPTIQSLVASSPAELIPTEAERLIDSDEALSTAEWRWEPAMEDRVGGVYRQHRFRGWEYWLKDDTSERRLPKSVGVYARSPSRMAFRHSTGEVVFHPEARPPKLYLRTLVLCSGYLPKLVRGGRLTLADIPPDIAQAVLSCLDQGER